MKSPLSTPFPSRASKSAGSHLMALSLLTLGLVTAPSLSSFADDAKNLATSPLAQAKFEVLNRYAPARVRKSNGWTEYADSTTTISRQGKLLIRREIADLYSKYNGTLKGDVVATLDVSDLDPETGKIVHQINFKFSAAKESRGLTRNYMTVDGKEYLLMTLDMAKPVWRRTSCPPFPSMLGFPCEPRTEEISQPEPQFRLYSMDDGKLLYASPGPIEMPWLPNYYHPLPTLGDQRVVNIKGVPHLFVFYSDTKAHSGNIWKLDLVNLRTFSVITLDAPWISSDGVSLKRSDLLVLQTPNGGVVGYVANADDGAQIYDLSNGKRIARMRSPTPGFFGETVRPRLIDYQGRTLMVLDHLFNGVYVVDPQKEQILLHWGDRVMALNEIFSPKGDHSVFLYGSKGDGKNATGLVGYFDPLDLSFHDLSSDLSPQSAVENLQGLAQINGQRLAYLEIKLPSSTRNYQHHQIVELDLVSGKINQRPALENIRLRKEEWESPAFTTVNGRPFVMFMNRQNEMEVVDLVTGESKSVAATSLIAPDVDLMRISQYLYERDGHLYAILTDYNYNQPNTQLVRVTTVKVF